MLTLANGYRLLWECLILMKLWFFAFVGSKSVRVLPRTWWADGKTSYQLNFAMRDKFCKVSIIRIHRVCHIFRYGMILSYKRWFGVCPGIFNRIAYAYGCILMLIKFSTQAEIYQSMIEILSAFIRIIECNPTFFLILLNW